MKSKILLMSLLFSTSVANASYLESCEVTMKVNTATVKDAEWDLSVTPSKFVMLPSSHGQSYCQKLIGKTKAIKVTTVEKIKANQELKLVYIYQNGMSEKGLVEQERWELIKNLTIPTK